MNKMTICKECRHLQLTGESIWDYFCKKAERVPCVDPVTGEHGYGGKNDLGGIYVTQDRYEHCKTINTTGECKMYERLG